MTHKRIANLETQQRNDLESVLNTYLAHSPASEKAERTTVAAKIRDMGTLTPTDLVCFSSLKTLTALPDGFHPQGNVYLHGCTGLTALPDGFNPQGNVYLSGCTGLIALPEGFNPQGDVDLSGCTGLAVLPDGFHPKEYVDLSECAGLTALPDGFHPQGNVYLHGCRGLTALPAGFNPRGNVTLSGCTGLISLPEGFNPQGDVTLSGCTGLITLPEGFNPQGDVTLCDCTGLTALPAGFNPRGDVTLSGCIGLTELPEGFHPQGNVYLSRCTGFTGLVEGFDPQGNVDLRFCTGLTALPNGFHPRGNIYLNGCTALTTIPESLFEMPATANVNLQNTGLSARAVEIIIQRMNAPEYNGPLFHLSVADSGYHQEVGVTAVNLSSINKSVGHSSRHPLWDVVHSQTAMGSPWNSFAQFLTRLLNETPRHHGAVPQQLQEKLKEILTAMEAEFAERDGQLHQCLLVQSVLAAAQTGIGTCIDKVKLGYVMMQLHLEKAKQNPDADHKIGLLARTIALVEGINTSDFVFDTSTYRFEPVVMLDRTFSEDTMSMVCTVRIGGIERLYTVDTSVSESHIKQLAISDINQENGDRFRLFRIGDEVEDILNLTYALPDMQDLHRIDMRFLGCRTMTDPVVVDAALAYIREGIWL